MNQLTPRPLATDPPEDGDRVLMWEEQDKFWISTKYYGGYAYPNNKWWLPDLPPPSLLTEKVNDPVLWMVVRKPAGGWLHDTFNL